MPETGAMRYFAILIIQLGRTMSKHLWMQDVHVAAYCPRCSAPAFKRSNTRSGIERTIRRFSSRVPYRCHECRYRTLVDPIRLRYPSPIQTQFEEHEDFTSNIEVPQIRIGSSMANDSDNRKSRGGFSRNLTTDRGKASKNLQESTNKSTTNEDSLENDRKLLEQIGKDEVLKPVDTSAYKFKTTSRQHSHRGRGHIAACPNCGEQQLYRSHSRTMLEAVLKKFTSRRLYRCHNCNWRGWLRKTA
jgi:uncharacterized protein with PIN domain